MASFPPIQFKRSIVAGAKPTDSDILIGELAINLRDKIIFTKDDSDRIIELGLNEDYDSELTMLAHDYQAADSDLVKNIDSDLLKLRHDFAAADSDAFKNIDSDIRQTVHDYLSNDSDFDSDLRVIVHGYLSNDSDHDSDIRQVHHDYQAADSDAFKNIDSDIVQLRHDFAAADSDIRVGLDSDVRLAVHNYLAADSDFDSDIRQLVKDYLAADSDQTLDSLNDVIYKDSDLGVDIRSAGKVLGWDSDLQVWKPVEAASAIANLKDVDLTGLEQGDALVYDSDTQTWKPGAPSTIAKLPDLLDVTDVGLKNGMILGWDSDSELWKPQLAGATEPVNQQFIATSGQTEFTLTYQPVGDVLFVRNSMMINITAYRDSENVVIYNPANNNNQQIQNNDRIEIRYNRLTSTVPTRTLSEITFQDLSGPVDGGNAAG